MSEIVQPIASSTSQKNETLMETITKNPVYLGATLLIVFIVILVIIYMFSKEKKEEPEVSAPSESPPIPASGMCVINYNGNISHIPIAEFRASIIDDIMKESIEEDAKLQDTKQDTKPEVKPQETKPKPKLKQKLPEVNEEESDDEAEETPVLNEDQESIFSKQEKEEAEEEPEEVFEFS